MNLNLPVSSIMTTNVECVSPDQKLLELKHIYEKQLFHHHIPVTEDGKLVGIVSLIDFMRAISNASLDDNEAVYNTQTVRDIMSIHPVSVAESATIREVAELLKRGEFHSVIIADNLHVTGIVTSADIIRLFLAEN